MGGDLDRGLDVLLERDDIHGDRACLVSVARGGYKTLKVAVTDSTSATATTAASPMTSRCAAMMRVIRSANQYLRDG